MIEQSAPPDLDNRSPASPGGPVVEPRFSSPRIRLDRLGTVRPGTVVVVLDAERLPLVKGPGELLLPSWAPWRSQLDAVVVRTESVPLSVGVAQLRTLDRQELSAVVLDVVVRVQQSALTELVAAYGADLEAQLTTEVQQTVESSLRAAVERIRAQDLRHSPLPPRLAEGWLPETFAGGGLLLESFTVREVRWSPSGDEALDDDDTMPLAPVPSQTAAPLTLGLLGRDGRHRSHRSAVTALEYVYVPAVVSVGAAWLFFVCSWVPEFRSVPGARFVLDQLAPLSWDLTGEGQPVTSTPAGQSGVAAVILLVVSLLIAPLSRSRYWLARLALWPLTYVGAIAVTVTVLGVLLADRLGAELVGVVLLVIWASAAVTTTWRSLWVDVDTLPRRPENVLWLVGVFALISPAPVALGRAVFAPELRAVADSLAGNDVSLRWAALLTPTTALLYLSGVLLGVLVWAGYLLWPPRRASRPSRPMIALLAALIGLLVVGPQATGSAARRVEVIRAQSPGRDLSFTCGVWTRQPAQQPVQTLVVNGLGCKRLTAFTGYHQVSTRETGIALSPVRADTMSGNRIPGRLVAAQYDGVVVLAGTDRLDHRLSVLLGIRLADAVELWHHPCPSTRRVRLTFVGAVAGDDAAAGRPTLSGERPAVLVDCGRGTVRLDPRSGQRR